MKNRTGNHDHKDKVVSFSDLAGEAFRLFLEYMYLLLQGVVVAFWLMMLIMTIAIFFAIGVIWYQSLMNAKYRKEAEYGKKAEYEKKANGGTSHLEGGELTADRSAAPLVGASGGGWSELYEKLDIRAAKLEEERQMREDDERHDQSDIGHIAQDAEIPMDVTSMAEERRRTETAMNKYLCFIR